MSLQRSEITYQAGDAIAPSNVWKRDVEKYAESVRKLVKLGANGDLKAAVCQLGGELQFRDLDSWAEESGSIYVHGPNDFDIILPQYTSPLRDRFTIAHELGHYFLHSRQGKTPLIATRKGTGRVEWEANWFAAALLMPELEFREAAKRLDSDIDRIAGEFGVSRDAARVRKERLGV